jgi:ornithine carbamoyltransferase
VWLLLLGNNIMSRSNGSCPTSPSRTDWLGLHDNATEFLYTRGKELPAIDPFPNSACQHVLRIDDLSKDDVMDIMRVALAMKKSTKEFFQTGYDRFSDTLKGYSLLTLFEKPSLRTRVSLEVGMHQLGGQAIFYSIADSPLGKKESIEDTGMVLSRMCQGITARVKSRNGLRALAAVSTIPVINALDDYGHPMQMLADLLTVIEHKGSYEDITMAFLGDLENNVTYDLMRLAALMGYHLNLAGAGEIEKSVWGECEQLQAITGSKIVRFDNAQDAAKNVDVVYCDSWMSYGIPEADAEARKKLFMPFQVNAELMKHAKKDAIFMNCLPAARGLEQTAEVIDGPQSVVFDQAENRLHAQKALLVFLMAPKRFGEIVAVGGSKFSRFQRQQSRDSR